MKLPENKKERIQMLVLLGISVLALLYFAIAFGIKPIIKNKKDRIAKIAELETKARDLKALLAQASGDSWEIKQALAKIKEYSDKYLLQPRLGENYFLGASETVEQWFKDAGIDKDAVKASVSETGKVPVQQAEAARRAVSAYKIRIVLQCDLLELIRLVKIIEDSSPFLCITDLGIRAQTGVPEKHQVAFTVEWPVWTESDMPARLDDQIRAAQSRQG